MYKWNKPFCVKVSQNALVGASRPSRGTQGTLPLPSRRTLPPPLSSPLFSLFPSTWLSAQSASSGDCLSHPNL